MSRLSLLVVSYSSLRKMQYRMMKINSKLLTLLMAPNISFAGGSGLAHLDPSLILFVVSIILGLFIYFIYCLSTNDKEARKTQWTQDCDNVSETLSTKGYKLFISDREAGTIIYKNNEQKIVINKHRNKWFLKADNQGLKFKHQLKAHTSVEDLNESLLKYIH